MSPGHNTTASIPPGVTASCCPLSCREAVWASFMRKQRVHTSFSEVRADLAQLPSFSISPCSHCLHHLQNSVPFTSLKTRPGRCLGQSSETHLSPDFHLSVSPFSAPGWPAGCCVPERESRGPGSTTACTEAARGSWHCSSPILGGALAQMHAPTLCSTPAKAEQDLSHQWGNWGTGGLWARTAARQSYRED